jgi:glycosyltransferase involved in cell wall biosynthesis
MTAGFRLSVVVPLHNEEANIPVLLQRTGAVLDGIPGGPHELLLVDDGSSDRTLELLRTAAGQDARITVISLSRNFGHQAALTAGLDHVSGDAVVIIDGDLQDPPESIPLLLERFHEGYDVVYAFRARRKEPWYLRACYALFYRLAARVAEMELPLDAGDFGVMSRRVVDHLRRLKEHHRFLRGLRSWVGFRQVGVLVERGERNAGATKYNAWRLFKLASDGIVAFSVIPIRSAALLGAMAIGAAALFSLYSIVVRLGGWQVPRGFTALTVLITFLSGVNLLFLGIIGEYVGRIYDEVKARPIYVVAEVVTAARPIARAAGQTS